MEAANRRVPVLGSEREALPNARVVGKPDPQHRIEVTVRVRSRTTGMTNTLQQMSQQMPGQRTPLSREEFAAAYGADPQDLSQIEAFAAQNNLAVIESSVARRSVILSGTVADMETAFGVDLSEYEHPGGVYRGRVGVVHVPETIAPLVEGVFGLDNRPQTAPHFRAFDFEPQSNIAYPLAGGTSYTPLQLAQIYNFPTDVTGQGQTIGIIELGGGYTQADLQTYFTKLNLPLPKVVAVGVDGGSNAPTGSSTGPDGEVMLDIEVAGAVAPAAQIVVYFAPNTDQGFLDAITTAVHDTTYRPSIISISWGGSESSWTAQALQNFDQAFQAAATLGVTVCCAAGDNGSSDGVSDSLAHVDFPASSPHVLACGGTSLKATGNAISSEVVWNGGATGGATGGGISDTFALPDWQKGANIPVSVNPGGKAGRGLPDIAADADPATGYVVQVDGQQTVFGGTSAVAPLWSGLVALLNQKLGKPIGFFNSWLYSSLAQSGVTHDITSGNNGAYQAAAGWDACTGWGSPNGMQLLQVLTTGGGITTPTPTPAPPPTPTPTPAPPPTTPPSQTIVGIAANPTGQGYWLAAADGTVYSVGNNPTFSQPPIQVSGNKHIVGITANPTGSGYWLVGADGTVYIFGDTPDFAQGNS